MLHLCWAKSSSCQNHTWLVRWQHMLLCSQYDATARPVLGSEATYMYKTGSLQLVVITREFRNTGYNTSPQSNEMWHTRLSNNCRCPLKGPICNGCQRWSVVCRSSAVCVCLLVMSRTQSNLCLVWNALQKLWSLILLPHSDQTRRTPGRWSGFKCWKICRF